MKTEKTYRIKGSIAEEIRKEHIKYMKETGERISETKIANAIMCIGIDEKNKEKLQRHLMELE